MSATRVSPEPLATVALATSVAVGAVIAIPITAVVAIVAYWLFAADCTTQTWCELSAAIGAGMIGCAVGYVTYLIAGWRVVVRLRAERRLRLFAAHTLVPPGAIVVVASLGEFVG